MSKTLKTLYSSLLLNKNDDINKILDVLTDEEKNFLLQAHSGDFNNKRIVLSNENTKKYYDLIYKLKYAKKINNRNDQAILTNSILEDFFKTLTYKELTKAKENHLIKKAKLSFYDEVDDETKELYIKYYLEEFPNIKEKYEKASKEEKKVILEEAIEDSYNFRNIFIENNQRLIWFYAKTKETKNLTPMELIQEGNIGLLNALKKFDFNKDNRFFAYGLEWVRATVDKAIYDKDLLIRFPVHICEDIKKINYTYSKLKKELEREPTIEEISKKTNISVSKIETLRKDATSKKDIESLDKYVIDDITIGDLVVSKEMPFTEIVHNKIFVKEFKDFLDKNLGTESKEILLRHYGFNDGKKESLHDISKDFNISRQTVYNREVKALKHLREKLQEEGFVEKPKVLKKQKI